MPAHVEAAVLELRREHRGWGPRRLVYELLKRGVEPVPSETGVYRALKRAGVIEPGGRRRRKDTWKRWERGSAMELWQMDIVGGFALRDGTFAKCLTGVDDHSRLCVSAKLMRRELSRSVCDGLEQGPHPAEQIRCRPRRQHQCLEETRERRRHHEYRWRALLAVAEWERFVREPQVALDLLTRLVDETVRGVGRNVLRPDLCDFNPKHRR